MADHSALHDVSIEASKAAPPVFVAAGHFIFGLSLSDWVAILTLVYLALQIGLLIPKYWARFVSKWKSKREAKSCQSELE